MAEQLEAQEAGTDRTEVPDSATGALSELPEELRPYSMIPWDSIPEENRQAVLEGVKKFHGGMTKQQQDVSRLKKDMDEFRRKADLLDQLVAEPWVREAWDRHQKGQNFTAQEPEKSVNLAEHLDADAAKAIETIIERALDKRLNPISNQITTLSQEQANVKAKTELADLAKMAAEKGWPSPYERLDGMSQLVAIGRAKSVEDAYRISLFDELPELIENKTKKSLHEELKSKAGKTVAPVMGPPQNGRAQLYTGRDAILKAFRDSKQELGY